MSEYELAKDPHGMDYVSTFKASFTVPNRLDEPMKYG